MNIIQVVACNSTNYLHRLKSTTKPDPDPTRDKGISTLIGIQLLLTRRGIVATLFGLGSVLTFFLNTVGAYLFFSVWSPDLVSFFLDFTGQNFQSGFDLVRRKLLSRKTKINKIWSMSWRNSLVTNRVKKISVDQTLLGRIFNSYTWPDPRGNFDPCRPLEYTYWENENICSRFMPRFPQNNHNIYSRNWQYLPGQVQSS